MHFSSEAEQLVFEKIAPQLRREGYEILSEPSEALPRDTRGYIPDFVARKGNEFIAIEVKSRRTPNIEKSLKSLKTRIEKSGNWAFRVYYADEEIEYENLPKPAPDLVREIARETLAASNQGFHKAASCFHGQRSRPPHGQHIRGFSQNLRPQVELSLFLRKGAS